MATTCVVIAAAVAIAKAKSPTAGSISASTKKNTTAVSAVGEDGQDGAGGPPQLPSGLSYVSSQPQARRQGSRQRCWTVRRLGARKSRTFQVTVRAARGANGRVTNRATVTSPDVKRATARDRVQVRGVATPVTG